MYIYSGYGSLHFLIDCQTFSMYNILPTVNFNYNTELVIKPRLFWEREGQVLNISDQGLPLFW